MSTQTFIKEERLKSRKDITLIVRKGKKLSSPIVSLYWIESQDERLPPIKVLFSVPKKKFKKAVDRNLLKRRMREAYRLNKKQFVEYYIENNKSVNLMFIYNLNEASSFAEIENKIVLLLKGLLPVNESNN